MDEWLAGDGPEDDGAEDIEERGEGKVKRFEDIQGESPRSQGETWEMRG
ncbi:hypothetical protein [Sorangium sp. So ce1000]